MNPRLFIVFIIFLCFAACKKREYSPEQVNMTKQDINFQAYFGNEPLALVVGENGYYCNTSYSYRADSIYVFKSELKKFDCNPCPQTFYLELYDNRLRLPGSAVNADLSLGIGKRVIASGLLVSNTLRFASRCNKEVSSIQWKVSNGTTGVDSVLNIAFSQPGPQTVSLTVKTTGNCESMVVNKIDVGADNSIFACGIASSFVQNNSAQFTANIIGGKAPFTYTWDFGDGTSSNSISPTHVYNWVGSYPVKLRVEDAEHRLCETNYIHVTANDNSSCAANISVSSSGYQNALLNAVKLQWTDQHNTIFRSDHVVQPVESYFEVIKSEEYMPNENGEKGRLLTIRFRVLLSDGSQQVWFKSENATIAVAYK